MALESGLFRALLDAIGWIVAGVATIVFWMARTLVFVRLDKLEAQLTNLSSLVNKAVTHAELSAAVTGLKSEINEVYHKTETGRTEIKNDIKEVKDDVREVRNDVKEVVTLLAAQSTGVRNNGRKT